MLLLSACAMGGSDTRASCPPVVEYSPAEQSWAAKEINDLPEVNVLVRMLSDYAVLRDQARACK